MQADKFDIAFKPIGGATWILQIDNLKIACDPILLPKGTVHDFKWFKSKRREEPVYEEEDFKGIDLWLLTHNHEDHLDEPGLQKISKDAEIVIHQNLKNRLKDYKTTILKHHKSTNFNLKDFEIIIEAIPAIHGVNPIVAYFAGGVNGYWLNISKDESMVQIYVSGDTVYKRKVTNALKQRKVDIYIPNVGAACKGTPLGTLTLNAKMLMKYINIIKPEITLPVHFGTFSHYNEPITEVEKLNHKSIKIVNSGEEFRSSRI